MAERDRLVEKKVKFLASWVNDEVTKDVMGKILHLIQFEKGSKVKLQLNLDGLRVMKNKIISGMVLQNFIPLKNIYLITVSHNVPCVLFVVSKGMHTYKIYTFRCGNALDAGLFIQGFRDIRKTAYSVTNKEPDGINWTLRTTIEDDKKQQNNLVHVNSGKTLVQINGGDVLQSPASPGHRFQKQDGKTPPGEQFNSKTMENAAKPVHRNQNVETNTNIVEVNTKTRTLSNGTISTVNASEVSKKTLPQELESMSKEVRDIKLMLEKFTAINPNHMRKQNNEDVVDVIVVLDDKDEIDTKTKVARRSVTGRETKPIQNGYTEDSLVRVSVPDFRYSPKHSSSKGIDSTDSSGYSSSSSSTVEKLKAPSTTYKVWKKRVKWAGTC